MLCWTQRVIMMIICNNPWPLLSLTKKHGLSLLILRGRKASNQCHNQQSLKSFQMWRNLQIWITMVFPLWRTLRQRYYNSTTPSFILFGTLQPNLNFCSRGSPWCCLQNMLQISMVCTWTTMGSDTTSEEYILIFPVTSSAWWISVNLILSLEHGFVTWFKGCLTISRYKVSMMFIDHSWCLTYKNDTLL